MAALAKASWFSGPLVAAVASTAAEGDVRTGRRPIDGNLPSFAHWDLKSESGGRSEGDYLTCFHSGTESIVGKLIKPGLCIFLQAFFFQALFSVIMRPKIFDFSDKKNKTSKQTN